MHKSNTSSTKPQKQHIIYKMRQQLIGCNRHNTHKLPCLDFILILLNPAYFAFENFFDAKHSLRLSLIHFWYLQWLRGEHGVLGQGHLSKTHHLATLLLLVVPLQQENHSFLRPCTCCYNTMLDCSAIPAFRRDFSTSSKSSYWGWASSWSWLNPSNIVVRALPRIVQKLSVPM